MALKWSGPWYGAVRRWAEGKLLNQRRLVLSGMHGHAVKQAKWYLRPDTGPGRKSDLDAYDLDVGRPQNNDFPPYMTVDGVQSFNDRMSTYL